MFTIAVETNFQASHQLRLADGSKEPMHRHNWLVAVEVSSDKLNSIGLVMDFHRLRAMVERIVAEFDNPDTRGLDSIDYFRTNNPSAEMIAKYIYETLGPELPTGVKLEAVRVVEEPGCSAKFGK